MSIISVIRNPKHPYRLMLQVDGKAIEGVSEVRISSSSQEILYNSPLSKMETTQKCLTNFSTTFADAPAQPAMSATSAPGLWTPPLDLERPTPT